MLSPFIINLLFAHTLMFGVWVIYKYQKIPMIADVFWPIGISCQGLIYCLMANRYSPLLLLLFIWGFRLSSFLYQTRLKQKHQDPRYQAIAAKTEQQPEKTFFINFQIQAFLQFLLASVWFYIAKQETMVLMLTSSCVVILGLGIEVLADKSLLSFKQMKMPGVCQQGLWQYSRHPNYFGELLIWFGFSLSALNQNFGIFGLISPITLYLIMRLITGPLSENLSLAHKGKLYQDYQANTPMIFPYKLFSCKRRK